VAKIVGAGDEDLAAAQGARVGDEPPVSGERGIAAPGSAASDERFHAPAPHVDEKDPGVPAARAHERNGPAVGPPCRRLHTEFGWKEDPAPASSGFVKTMRDSSPPWTSASHEPITPRT
jgi:hypothetical protein